MTELRTSIQNSNLPDPTQRNDSFILYSIQCYPNPLRELACDPGCASFACLRRNSTSNKKLHKCIPYSNTRVRLVRVSCLESSMIRVFYRSNVT
jgi:hypothetical protein